MKDERPSVSQKRSLAWLRDVKSASQKRSLVEGLIGDLFQFRGSRWCHGGSRLDFSRHGSDVQRGQKKTASGDEPH